MKINLKNERGVSLISLAVAIIVLGIITSMLLYNVKDTNDIQRISNMYTDIDVITDRISNYYSQYGALPVVKNIDLSSDSTISRWISDRDSTPSKGPLGKNDSNIFYVIDLNALENLSLNYGRGFKEISGSTLPSSKDVYVINENSHNIFYLCGIEIDNSGVYYTNQDKDTETVDIRYVAGIKIPDGFVYKSGNTKNDLKIEKVVENGKNIEYTWANTADELYSLTQTDDKYYLVDSNSVSKLIAFYDNQKSEELIESAKEYGGFYYTEDVQPNQVKVNYRLVVEEDNWSAKYENNAVYTDINGDTAYIPAGFRISKLSTLNTISKGLVIKKYVTEEEKAKGDYGDEYVWIDVPDEVLENARTLDEIEKALQEYTRDYREEGCSDNYWDGLVMTYDPTKNSINIYNELKNKMLQSIKENGGFYVGRYEAGKTDSGELVSQKDNKPYNMVTISKAQDLADNESNDNYTTTLMFGIQWDLICKFLENTGDKTYNELKNDSTNFGNYSNSHIVFNENERERRKLMLSSATDWQNITKGYNKESGTKLIYTTGASELNKTNNIYDLAGNVFEITLENSNNLNVKRGGGYQHDGTACALSSYLKNSNESSDSEIGFRVTLFK